MNFVFDIRVAIFFLVIVLLAIFIIIDEEGAFKDGFFHFGPSSDTINVYFAGTKLKKWNQVILLYFVSFFAGLITLYYSTVIQEVLHSYIFDQEIRVVRKISKKWAIFSSIIDPILLWFVGIVDFFLISSFQLQFLLPALLAEILIEIPYSVYKISQKKFIK